MQRCDKPSLRQQQIKLRAPAPRVRNAYSSTEHDVLCFVKSVQGLTRNGSHCQTRTGTQQRRVSNDTCPVEIEAHAAILPSLLNGFPRNEDCCVRYIDE